MCQIYFHKDTWIIPREVNNDVKKKKEEEKLYLTTTVRE